MHAETIALVVSLAAIAVGGTGMLWNWRRRRHRGDPLVRRLPPEYFEALSFLLDEQMDRALDVFLELADRETDAVELHFALGSLFRRKGEIERATLIHQNLIARPALSRDQRELALKELGQDYLRAGLNDRAERIFTELLDLRAHQDFAARSLIAIYEQQQDWAQAAALRRRLEWITHGSERAVVAQYYCEMAETARERGDSDAVAEAIAEARRNARDVPRVRLLSARAASEAGRQRAAAREYRELLATEPGLAEVILPPYAALFAGGARDPDFENSVRRVLSAGQHAVTPLAVAGLRHPDLRSPVILEAIEKELTRLIEPLSDREFAPLLESPDVRAAMLRLLTGWVIRRPLYQCRNCGFQAHELYWHCPGCRRWDTMRLRADVFPEPGLDVQG